MSVNKKALVVIPVLDEEETIAQVIKGIPQKVLDISVDILVIDDGSQDASAKISKKNGAMVIKNSNGRGYGGAVLSGLGFARKNGYDFVVKLDGDGQHISHFVSTVIKILARGGVDYVFTSRYMRQIDRLCEPPAERRLINIMMTGLVNNITKNKFSDVFCGFFGMTKDTLLNSSFVTHSYGLELEILLKLHFSGKSILEIPHPLIYTNKGSKFSQFFGESHKTSTRALHYYEIVEKTLKELKVTIL